MSPAASLLIYSSIGAITPGPNNITCMSNALRMGVKKSIGYNFGVYIGYLVVNTLCLAFSAPLYNSFPFIKPYIQAFGAAYLVWMAFKVIASTGKGAQEALKIPHTFWPSFFFQFMNPKALFYSLSSVAMFILPNYKGWAMPLLLIFIISTIGFICTLVWSFFGLVFQKMFTKYEKSINIIMALLLAYCALSLYL